MSWVSGLAIYAVIWWLVLFAVLPWGVRVPENPEKGHATSAPANPRLGLKVLVTSVVAAVVWVALYLLLDSGLISFRDS